MNIFVISSYLFSMMLLNTEEQYLEKLQSILTVPLFLERNIAGDYFKCIFNFFSSTNTIWFNSIVLMWQKKCFTYGYLKSLTNE